MSNFWGAVQPTGFFYKYICIDPFQEFLLEV